MNYKDLEKNIVDTIIEQQIKLGYEKETVGLYYPVDSIVNLLNLKDLTIQQLDSILGDFRITVEKTLGNIIVERNKERYCFKVPPQGSAYVHSIIDEQSFLVKFIRAISQNECTLEDLLRVFYEFSKDVICDTIDSEEFDFVISFQDDRIDPYCYCIKKEDFHMTYHRFTKKDYLDLNMR